MEMMRVTVKDEPELLGWRYTTLKKTLMEAEYYAGELTSTLARVSSVSVWSLSDTQKNMLSCVFFKIRKVDIEVFFIDHESCGFIRCHFNIEVDARKMNSP